MELGRECLSLWGYERVDELIWVKSNQLQRIIRTGRTGHWLNHGKVRSKSLRLSHDMVTLYQGIIFPRRPDFSLSSSYPLACSSLFVVFGHVQL